MEPLIFVVWASDLFGKEFFKRLHHLLIVVSVIGVSNLLWLQHPATPRRRACEVARERRFQRRMVQYNADPGAAGRRGGGRLR